MNPLFFGQAGALTYGVHHPPKVEGADNGVVLCYPFGQEYMRAHRAYRQLAFLLTRIGLHVLRFDYRGTGDSSGELDTVTTGDWVQDVGHAIQELRDIANIQRVSVLGLRLGALVAAQACRDRSDVDRLILWDPVLSGAHYEAELKAEVDAERPSSYGASSGNGEDAAGTLHYNGFPLGSGLRASMRRMDLLEALPTGVPRVLLAVSHETADFTRLRSSWSSHSGLRYVHAPAPHDWNFVDNFGGILLPQAVIRAIVSWVENSDPS
jgi:pimeloyl-ACP methyl ester carboxylesterase